MIQTHDLTKVFGSKRAVDHLTVTVRPGQVTGFLGPNGAGKSTTMRLIVALDRPTAGDARINGKRYQDLKSPLTEVGILLDARAVHPGRTARSHLRAMAATHKIPARRVDEVIELTGIQSVANKRVGGYSLGMHQRLGIAAALLGDPATLILDEPVNGLDPEGVAWVRSLTKALAGEGRTVLISSHLMSEMAQTADHVIIMGMGRLIADMPIGALLERSAGVATLVRSPQAPDLAAGLAAQGATVTAEAPGLLRVSGMDAARVGEEAAAHGWVLHELRPVEATLEAAYLELTAGAVEYHSAAPVPVPPVPPVAPMPGPPGPPMPGPAGPPPGYAAQQGWPPPQTPPPFDPRGGRR